MVERQPARVLADNGIRGAGDGLCDSQPARDSLGQNRLSGTQGSLQRDDGARSQPAADPLTDLSRLALGVGSDGQRSSPSRSISWMCSLSAAIVGTRG